MMPCGFVQKAMGNAQRSLAPAWRAARCNFGSRVQSSQSDSSVEASRCASTQPIPQPHNFRESTKRRVSPSVAGRAYGRALSSRSTVARFFRYSQASSQMTKGCTQITPSVSCSASEGSPLRRCSIQTEVSARTNYFAAGRRRRGRRRSGWVPPSAARRFPASR